MEISRTTWGVTATATAASICLIAVIGRVGRADFPHSGYSPKEVSSLDAYLEPVKSFYAYRVSTDSADLLEARDVWMSQSQSGNLNDILPSSLQDQGHDGVKGEILHAKLKLCLALSNLARKTALNGDIDEAANLYVDAFEIAGIGKFSGFSSSLDSVREQERILMVSQHVIAEASPQVQDRAISAFTKLRRLADHTDSITARMQTIYEKEQELRTGDSRSWWEIGYLYEGIDNGRYASASTNVDSLGLLNNLDERLHRAYVFGVATAAAETRLLEEIASFTADLAQTDEQV